MCGRFALTADTAILRLRYRIATESPVTVALAPRFNCAPMQRLPVILPERQDSGRWGIRHFQWGLVQSWQNEPSGTDPLINARCETF